VKSPRDPVTGKPAVETRGLYGPHYSKKGLLGGRRCWYEGPLDVVLFAGTKHETVAFGIGTVWASAAC
jgi:hypothetical protein